VRIIDLTLPLDETFSDFHPPSHPDFGLEVFARLKTRFRHNCKFSMSVHIGSPRTGFKLSPLRFRWPGPTEVPSGRWAW
jgi:hypothetical protein